MTFSRREFVKTGAMMGLSAVAALKGAISVFGQQASFEQDRLFKLPDESQADERLTEETFSRYVSTTFRIYTSPLTAINVELIKVSRRESPASEGSAKTPELDCFSVVFRGPRKLALQSRTYRVEHDQMGAFDLFITPVDDHKKQRRYQAVFNRVKQ
jgi:hypothetical protein